MKVIKGELMHLQSGARVGMYVGKLNVTGIAHSFNSAHLSTAFRANGVSDVPVLLEPRSLSGSLLMHISCERSR